MSIRDREVMALAVFETWLESDLQQLVKVRQLTGNLFSADNGGNKIGVKVYDGGQTASLSGTVTGYIIREDNATVTVTGTLSGNTAFIVLPASAYLVVGRISIVIKLGTTTLAACTAYVYRTTTDTLVDPGHVIPSIAELLAKIGDCETATANANSKANLADQKATLADQKATAANNAASAANTAAGKIDGMTVAVNAGGAGQNPTATLTLENGHYKLTFANIKGVTGDAFHIVKTYASIAAMEADFSGTDTQQGDFVMIVSNVEDPDNAKVYIKGASAWGFVVDMSGATGIQGPQGPDGTPANVFFKWSEEEPTSDADLKDVPDNWIGIYAGTASTAPTAYTSYTWFEWKGAKGDTGNTGATGADAHVYFKWSATEPTQDSDMKDTADAWIGVYSGTASSAPTTYTSYVWYRYKGETPTVYANTIALSSSDSTTISEAFATKATKVVGATSGNLAGLDGNGNLTDSGKAPADFVASDQGSGYAGKVLGIGNDGMVTPVPFSGDDFTGATALSDGVHGYVPKPLTGEQGKFLKGDGTWANVPDPQTMTGATASVAGAGGLVPTPTAGSNVLFLCGDATWKVPPGAKWIFKDLDTVTNMSGSYTHTTTIADVASDMKPVLLELGDPTAFKSTITITPADGSVTLSCAEVSGTSTVKVGFVFEANAGAITSTEFDVLNNRLQAVENVCADTDVTIATTDWALANGVYSFVWSNALIASTSLVEIFLRDGAESAGISEIDYTQTTGSVTIVTEDTPTASLPITIRIIHTKLNGLQELDATQIASEAVTGCETVEEALTALAGLDYQIHDYNASVTVQSANYATVNVSSPAITGYTAYMMQLYSDKDLVSISARWLTDVALNVTVYNFYSSAQTVTVHATILYVKNTTT